jgi:hypothetical protein
MQPPGGASRAAAPGAPEGAANSSAAPGASPGADPALALRPAGTGSQPPSADAQAQPQPATTRQARYLLWRAKKDHKPILGL